MSVKGIRRFLIAWTTAVLFPTGAVLSFAQELIPLFPVQGSTIPFSDLVDKGFQWQAPAGATLFQIDIIGPPPFSLQNSPTAASSPFRLPQNYGNFFSDGDYQYRIVIQSGVGTGTISAWVGFTLGGIPNLHPTPTPAKPALPSGDADGSAKVDGRDIMILSSLWGVGGSPALPVDLNQDSAVNALDLLLYIQRYGQTIAVAPIGMPRDLTYDPDAVVTLQQTDNLILRWSPPAYPADTDFTYEILVVLPTGKDFVSSGDLKTTSFQPFKNFKTTLTGNYTVYLRAKDGQERRSEILVSTFTVIPIPFYTPTPTPAPLNPDLSPDGKINGLDAATFAAAFGTKAGDSNFNPAADLFTDGVIDRKDLLLFQLLFFKRSEAFPAPVWLYAYTEEKIIPPPIGKIGPTTVKFPPNEIRFGVTNPKSALAELYYTTFYFSAVPGAVDYFVSIQSEVYKDQLPLEFFTKGQPSFNSIHSNLNGQYDILQIQVQATGEGLQFGEKSEYLRVIIPAQTP